MSDQTPLEFGSVEPIELQEEMERSFLDYAMSVIVARALPDARDGLKPVHRRILYGMFDQGLRPDRPHAKCARVTGDVMGKYHPHGDSAIYDALVRMAQPFSLRHPLIDFHGNYGSQDFEPAAARYCVTGDTRVRLADGTSVSISDLVDLPANSEADADFEVLDKDGKAVRVSKVFNSGVHSTKRLTTKHGFSIRGTHNHPVLCLVPVAGVPMFQWLQLNEITPRTVVCVARNAWMNVMPTPREATLGILCGAWVSEGWASETRAGFNNTDSPLGELIGKRAEEKFVPEAVWQGGWGVKRAFLMAVYEGDGGPRVAKDGFTIHYSTYSERLARELQELLAEFGVIAARHRYKRPSGKFEHRLIISGLRNVKAFAERVGFLRTKQAKLEELVTRSPLRPHRLSGDHVPYVADYVRDSCGPGRGTGKTWLEHHNFERMERWETERLRIIDRIKDPEVLSVILPIMDSGYRFEEVATVEDCEAAQVYSVRVDSDDHSFLAGGFVNHNTECRLGALAMQLLAGIDEGTVDMVANYDGREQEPAVLPARFPNLLVNGSQGIAVGMATNIPPHNLGEIIDAVTHLIDHPDATPDQLMEFVKGPDFPTGAFILGRAGIMDAYRTGRGSIRMRARAEIVEGKHGDEIVVTQLPYQTSVSTVATKIEDLVNSRQLEGIRDVRNLSAGVDTKLVIYLKRDAPANVVLNNLYKHTPLQTSFGVNMVALVDGVPRTLNLAQALQAYVEHQVEVIRRRSEHRLKKAQDRAHIVEGLLKALDKIDQIIALIRGSNDRDSARQALMAKPFAFSEIQANHILDMRLVMLTRLNGNELKDEMAKLRETIGELEAILRSPARLRDVIKSEMGEIREKFATPRRAEITFDPGEIDLEDLIEDEDLVVTLSRNGYVKSVSADAFRTQGRGGRGVQAAKLRDNDYVAHLLMTTAHSYLLFFSNRGKVYRLKAHEIPMKDRTARGTAIVNLLALAPDERIAAVIDTRTYEDGRYLFFATKNGQVKKTLMSEYDTSRRDGIIAINLKDKDELVRVIQTGGEEDIFMVSRMGQTIRFTEDAVRAMGRSAAGVIGMRLRQGDEVVSCDVARDDVDILIVTDAGYGKRTKLERFPRKGRGTMGVKGIKLTARRGYVVSAFMVGLDDELFLISSAGVTIRMSARDISSQGRDATGVRVMSLEKEQTVATAAPVLQVEEAE
jgi:DNA gyrase subunit A